MAVSPIFILRLKRMIERLSYKHRLSKSEEIELSGMLTADEKGEVEFRRREIFHINSLMAMQLEDIPNSEELWWSSSMNKYRESWKAVRFRVPDVERYTQKRWEIANKAIAMDYRDKSIAEEAIEYAKMGDDHKQCLVDNLFREFDNLSGVPKLAMAHWGPRTYENLPSWVESVEDIAWPNHPNANRQAHIEVLKMKLERLLKGS